MSDGQYTALNVVAERRNTAMLVRLYGRMIQIHRPAPLQPTTAGGVARTGNEQLFAPKLRWISTQGREQYEIEPVVGAGTRLKHYIIGTFDDDIRQGDWFINPIDGRRFTVQYVHEDRTVETRANIEPVE